jgi:acetyl-CoA carboxylase biotin carboxyl carrier protein
MSEVDGSDALSVISRQLELLANRLPGSLRRLSVTVEGHGVEVEWSPDPGHTSAPASPLAAGAEPPPGASGSPNGDARLLVRSPLVGTFYAAPQPGAAPFVSAGDVVAADQTVAIVEAMKLMNNIVAGRAGRVVEVLVGNAERVEFDQSLIVLEPVEHSEARP